MSKSFEASIQSVREIFSGNKRYIVPNYQRPYAWRKEQAEALFSDLWSKFKDNKEEEYFLNNVFLISVKDEPLNIVDGQQRLTTLTILLALLRRKLADAAELCAELDNAVMWGDKFRLRLRTKDKSFFQSYIQGNKIDALLKMDVKGIGIGTPAQGRILENAKLLNRKIETVSDKEELKLFALYVLKDTFLAVISANDILSGHEIFDRINASGLPLSAADILKAFFLGRIKDEKEQEEYVNLWEDWENKTAPDFLHLLGCIRLIITRKSSAGLVKDFKNNKKLRGIEPKEFIDDYLVPYARLYLILRDNDYSCADADCAKQIRHSLHWLGMIWDLNGLEYWVPAAMQFLNICGDNAESAARFFKLLEKWVTVTYLGSKKAGNNAHWFYNYVWDTLGDNCNIGALEQKIERDLIEWGCVADFGRYIKDDIYGNMPYARQRYLMLRLNGLVGHTLCCIPEYCSIEHIMPQTVDENSRDSYSIAKVAQDRKVVRVSADAEGAIHVIPWAVWWPDAEEREEWRNKLGNLVLLDRSQNSWASNNDFGVKKQIYFSYGYACPFPLTSEVLKETEWTPEVVKARQDRLVGLLCEAYGIKDWQKYRIQE